MEADVIIWLIVIFLGVMFFSALITVVKTFARVGWVAYMLITFPIRFVMRHI